MKFKNHLLICVISIFLAGLLFSCSSSEDDDDESSTGSSESTNVSSTTVTNMQAVSNGFIPDSMESSSSSSSSAKKINIGLADDDSGDPCEGTDLFGCQSRLVKMYIEMSKDIFDQSISIISDVGSNLGDLGVGASGNTTVEDGTTIHYNVVSATEWDFLAVTSLGTYFDLSINANTYSLKMDAGNSTDSSDSDDMGQLSMVVSYTDDENWSLTSSMVGFTCNSDDVRAPERIKIVISRVNDVYTGKAMLYSPRWAYFESEPTCSSTVDDDYATSMYTDFVANDTAGKVKVYMMKRTVTDVSTIENYPMSGMCDVFYENFGFSSGSNCSSSLSSYGFDMSQYPNPFCTTGPDQATWDSDCTGVDSTIQATSFSASSEWTAPATHYVETITLRSSL